ncbi:hypothetical protein RRG08_028518 [Elysia crispata]|uniref:Uncharacterized protein n=1 Tax=Elysia crispata TaxID=231223 RepID=A0AAE0Y9G8_9GAST|nr:hypothetical protein RRG08_028518 [Elysia crispata]
MNEGRYLMISSTPCSLRISVDSLRARLALVRNNKGQRSSSEEKPQKRLVSKMALTFLVALMQRALMVQFSFGCYDEIGRK